jgi:hypothetical protein
MDQMILSKPSIFIVWTYQDIWVYQMIIQAHLGIIVALDVMLDWRD